MKKHQMNVVTAVEIEICFTLEANSEEKAFANAERYVRENLSIALAEADNIKEVEVVSCDFIEVSTMKEQEA